MTTPQTPVDALMALIESYIDEVAEGRTGEEEREAVEASARSLAAIPEGFVLVPEKATPAIEKQIKEVAPKWFAPSVWRALIEAAAAATTTPTAPTQSILYEHEDGRYAVNPDTTGDSGWHRLGPCEVFGAPAQDAQGEYPAPYRCLKPHCPPRCSGCNHAIPVTDTPRMLMVKVLDSLAVDDLGHPFEEGDHMAVDEATTWP